MAQPKMLVLGWILLLLAIVEATSPGIARIPRIANNPSHARCMIKKYKHCYNLEHVCPEFCPDGCTVECASCKPICTSGATSATSYSDVPPLEFDKLLSMDDNGKSPPSEDNQGNQGNSSPSEGDQGNSPPSEGDQGNSPPSEGDQGNSPPSEGDQGNSPPSEGDQGKSPPSKGDEGKSPKPSPASPTPTPQPIPSTPSHSPPTSSPSPSTTSPPSTPNPPTPSRLTPPPSTSPTPPSSNPSTAPTSPPTTLPPFIPTPSTPSRHPPTSPASAPKPSTPSPSTPTPPNPTPSSPSPSSSPTPSTPSPSTPTPTPATPTPSPPSSRKRVKCKNTNYGQCYGEEHVCPANCPTTCEVDCVTCKPVCKCDYPGAVCQDPRFIGGDGVTFYFHGKKERDFCLVSDTNLHINAHFIGKTNPNMTRDFTWVQSIGILFNNRRLFIGAQKTATWNDAVDRLAVAFDGEPIFLPQTEGSVWQSSSTPAVSITRSSSSTNNVVIEVEGNFKITAKAVPITEEESRVHNYGITEDDCFAHLDLGFKFYSLSKRVDGVLGKTYRDDYVSNVNIGVAMPVMGGDREYASSGIFTRDCSVARFQGGGDGGDGDEVAEGLALSSLSCDSGMNGEGVVCKR